MHTKLLSTFSNAFRLQSFFPPQKSKQKSINFYQNPSETMSACITYTIWNIKNGLIMHIFPIILKFLFSKVKISLLKFAMHSLQFSLTWDVLWWLQKYTPMIRIRVFQERSNNFSGHLVLLSDHIASDFIYLYLNS